MCLHDGGVEGGEVQCCYGNIIVPVRAAAGYNDVMDGGVAQRS